MQHENLMSHIICHDYYSIPSVCMCAWVCLCACVCVRARVCACVRVCVHMCTGIVCVRKCISCCICVSVYAIQPCIHTDIHAYPQHTHKTHTHLH